MSDLGSALSDRITMLRGRGAFGRKPKRSVVSQISQDGPVQIHHHHTSHGEDGQFTIETVQDVSPILNANVAEMNSGNDGYTPSRDLRKVASIPLIEVHRLLQQGIDIFKEADWPKIAAKLDDPEWSKFRTSPGKISRRPFRQYLKASSGR